MQAEHAPDWPGPIESLDSFLEKVRSDPLLHLLRDGIVVIDAEKRVRLMNRAAEDLLKIRESDAQGQSCYRIVRSEVCRGMCGQCLNLEGSPYLESFNVDVLTHTGEVIACCLHTAVLKDRQGATAGYIEHFREMGQVREIINQQSELLRLYANEKEKVQTLVNSIEDGVFTVGLDGRIRSLSPRLESLVGWKEKDLLGKEWSDLLVSGEAEGDSARTLLAADRRLAEFRDQRFEMRTARGVLIPVSLSTVPLKGPEEDRIGLLCLVRDLREIEELKKELHGRYSFGNILGTGPRMRELFELIERLSDTTTNVLIQGESGTGKELVARALHYHSPRKDKPFLKINCSALPDPLLESELFGYEKGAFTGATHRKPGKFKLADGGTIFLDEIGDTSPAFQAKLLRVVQDLEFEPLGSTRVEKVDVRILAATHRDLKADIAAGRFREDLYYRLCVVPIFLPPLRERKEDIPLLVSHFLEKVAAKHKPHKVRKPWFSPQAMAILMDYDWPGNIRELENVVERAVVCSASDRLDPSVLPREIRVHRTEAGQEAPGSAGAARGAETDEFRKIREVLDSCGGNKTLAARKLGISRTTLWRRIRDGENSGAARSP